MTTIFDIESHGASQRFQMSPGEFFRAGGVLDSHGYRHTLGHASMVTELQASPLIVGHNVVPFDVPALGLDPIQLASERRLLDTMILDYLRDPPDFGMPPKAAMRMKYGLDVACARYGVDGKSHDLKALAKAAGGFGAIPAVGEYLDYLRGDLVATKGLLDALLAGGGVSEYAWREHRVAALMSNMTAVGIAVDRELLDTRARAGEARQAELIDWLVREHGVPTTLPNGEQAKSPQASKAGKQALVEAFASVGVSQDRLPVTPKGAASFSADALTELGQRFPAARDLCDAVAALVGVRSVYGTAERYVRGDGRVHPNVTLFQASGRASITEPGMTVFGKRDGRVQERDVFVANPGNVLISADLSQVDARAVAAHSGDPEYVKLFAPGVDAHMEIAYMVWGRSEVGNDPKGYRNRVKAITHGSSYGMGVPKLAASAGVPESEAQRVVDTLRSEFPVVESWKREVRERAESGELLDNGFGKLMRPNPERAFTQGPALYGQGTARDILMEGCVVRMPLEIQRMQRTLVHDEGVWECRREDAAEVSREIVKALTFEWCPPWMSRPVQFEADCSVAAERWSGCY